MPFAAPIELLRVYLMLAAVAFAIGFIGCLVFSGPTASAQVHPTTQAAVISGPASEDWNLPKRI